MPKTSQIVVGYLVSGEVESVSIAVKISNEGDQVMARQGMKFAQHAEYVYF